MLKRNENIDRRCRPVSEGKRGDGPVVYWMSRDQRAADNWALLWAQQEAMSRDKGLQVIFCYNPVDGFITARHALFALKGLAELQQTFFRYNIDFIMLEGDPAETIPSHLKKCDGHVLATDFSPLRRKRRQLACICERISLPIYEIDSHNIIPVWVISDKKEYGAYTIRPKINRLLPEYLTDFPELQIHPTRNLTTTNSIDVPRLAAQATNQRVAELTWLYPGESAARSAMADVLKSLADYAINRNDPNKEAQSNMSPYLHFGQLSPQRLAWEVDKSDLSAEVRERYLEELIVRRELADNFCFYEASYDHFEGFPDWAKKSLDEHRYDTREYRYSLKQFEQAETHESLWNACQVDLVNRGKLHGYLRMYWAKKILEWTSEPEEALEYALKLNDTYSLDGSDPNGHSGVSWAIGGVHDRAWKKRPVYGKIRYMNEAGCRRKFDVDYYLQKVSKSSL
jgi:deoxyribodipyrimidine photo-lyase